MIGGTLAEEMGLKMVYSIAACILVISTIIILFAQKQPVEKHPHEESRLKITQNTRFITLLAVLFFTIFATYLPQPLTANFLQNVRGLNLSQIGTLGSIGSLGNAMLAIGLGTINARIGFLIGQMAVMLASIIIWKGTGLPWYMLGYFFLGGFRICKSLAMALARPLIHASQMGVAYGFMETVASIAIIIAPPISGYIYQFNPEMVYIVSAFIIALVLLGSIRFIPHDHIITEELLITPERD
jgi:MFS family permease